MHKNSNRIFPLAELLIPTSRVIPTVRDIPTPRVIPTNWVIPTGRVIPADRIISNGRVFPTNRVIVTSLVVPTKRVTPTIRVILTDRVFPTNQVILTALAFSYFDWARKSFLDHIFCVVLVSCTFKSYGRIEFFFSFLFADRKMTRHSMQRDKNEFSSVCRAQKSWSFSTTLAHSANLCTVGTFRCFPKKIGVVCGALRMRNL